MDGTPKTVLQIFQQFNVNQIIHGHTHRQNIHKIPPHFTRIVLVIGEMTLLFWQYHPKK